MGVPTPLVGGLCPELLEPVSPVEQVGLDPDEQAMGEVALELGA